MQLLYVYLSVTLIAGKSLIWQDLVIVDETIQVEQLSVICIVICIFSCLIYVMLIATASKLLHVKSLTEFDRIRTQDGQLYEPVVCNATTDTKSSRSEISANAAHHDPYTSVSPRRLRKQIRTEMD